MQETAQAAFVFSVTATEGIEVPATVAMSPATLATLTASSMALEKSGGGPPTNVLRALFQPRGPGIHRARLLLNSPDDVRVLDIEYNAQPSGQTATLQLCCPVRQSLLQEVRLPSAFLLAVWGRCSRGSLPAGRSFLITARVLGRRSEMREGVCSLRGAGGVCSLRGTPGYQGSDTSVTGAM